MGLTPGRICEPPPGIGTESVPVIIGETPAANYIFETIDVLGYNVPDLSRQLSMDSTMLDRL